MANWAIFDWIRLRRLVGIDPATPLDTQEGQVRYQRSSDSADGLLYLARRTSGGTMEWKDLTAGGGGGGTTITVQEGDSTVDASVTTLDFNGSDFNVTSSPAGEANVSIADNYVLNTGDAITGDLLLQSTSATQLQAKNAGGTEYFRVDTNNGYFGSYNGADILVYSDAGITVKYSVDGATGVVTFGLPGGATVPSIRTGTGSPEGVVSAQVSSLFLRSDGSTDTSVYRKESGTGNTGWVAVAAGSGLTHPQVMSRAWLVS